MPDYLDINPADNVDTLYTQVLGPYDPNAKSVNRPLYTSARKDWLNKLEFQNTGNYPAQDVVVLDKMDPRLDLSTLRLISATHGTPKLLVQDDNTLVFRFDDINLPDSVHNEPGSHGSFTYMISPRQSVKVGDSITNEASIFFDYNAPVHTDKTLNIINEEPTTVATLTPQQELLVYPNPGRGTMNIETTTDCLLYLSDMQGRIMAQLTVKSGKTLIKLPESLSSGLYFLHGKTMEGRNVKPRRITVLR
jgi:hypothetical protein